jgi:RNA polymerase sigma-70 factor (ECF subfamily)
MSRKEALFHRILEGFQDKIYRLCCCYVRHEEDRKDLLHDIYIRIWSGLGTFDQKSSLSTWIYRISANSCIDFLRKEKKRRALRFGIRVEEQQLVDASENVKRNFLASEKIKILYASIDKLSLLEKTLISLYLEDLSYKEMADIVGISEQNVGVRLFRIKKTLNSLLKEAG